jgi:ubiquinone/menaquinone biosynthesis C-methylase UbiE
MLPISLKEGDHVLECGAGRGDALSNIVIRVKERHTWIYHDYQEYG